MGQRLTIAIVSILFFSVTAQAVSVPLGRYADGIGDDDSGMYGQVVEFLPDFDGDGIYDIAVSAPGNSSNGQGSGAVFVFFGPIAENRSLDHDQADMVLMGRASEGFGTAMDRGDLNGDGLTDLIIGAPEHLDQRGSVYIFHGGTTANRTSEDANATLRGSWMGQRFGQSVAVVGNLNGDIYDDFVIGAPGSNAVFVYHGAKVLETPMAILPEVEQDYPDPADFTNGLNSTGNTFGLGNVSDGWDWKRDIYGGSNADVDFPPLVNQGGSATRLEVMMGNTTDGNGDVPSASGGYGVEFQVTDDMMAALGSGGELHVHLTWTTRDTPDGGSGLDAWQGEVYWVKCRFWNSSANATYLGWNYDGDNSPADDEDPDATTDSTLELYYVNWAWGSSNIDTYSYSEDLTATHLVDGAHTYYLDAGGKLSDWSTVPEGLEVSIDDVSIGVEFHPVAELLGPASDAEYGASVAGVGDVNRDGYDDIMVGAPGTREAHIYFGSPDLGQDFGVYTDWAIPGSQGVNDTTFENNVNDIMYNDGGWGDTNWYSVDMGQVMWIDGWSFSGLRGEVVEAYLYILYKTSPGYNGNNWVHWSLDGVNMVRTDLHPTNTNGNSANNYGDQNGPYPLHDHGLSTLDQLRDMDLEFTNNAQGGGIRTVYFDFAWAYVITQMASNVTIKGVPGGALGSSGAGLGDINGDNYEDIIIGDPSADHEKGAAYVFTGGKDLIGNLTVDDAYASFKGTRMQDNVGWSVASAGLFSLDGIPDIAVGSRGDGNGTLFIVRGAPDLRSGPITEVAQYQMEGDAENGRFSMSIAAMGDIDGRYAGELLVGAPMWNTPTDDPENGAVFILYNTDEDVLEQPLIMEFYPATDPTINEGEEQLFGVVLNVPDELGLSLAWQVGYDVVAKGTTEYKFKAGFSSAGVYDISVAVEDGFGSGSHSWKLTVLDVNGPPLAEFHPGHDPVLDEGDSMRFWTVASDPDGDVLSFDWSLDGMTRSTGTELILVTDHTMAGPHNLTCEVSDGQFTISHTWDLTIMDLNRPPVIEAADPVDDPSIHPDELQGFSVTATDPDGDELISVWYVDGTVAALNTFELTLVGEHVKDRDHEVRIMVSDGMYWVEHIWTMTVTGGSPPTIDWCTPESPVHLNEGDGMVFWVSATDPDGDELGITWVLDGVEVGEGLSYDLRTRVGDSGYHNLEVKVSDVGNGTYGHVVSKVWDIHVNRAPRILDHTSSVNGSLSPGQTLRATIQFLDDDIGDTLTVTWYLGTEIISVMTLRNDDRALRSGSIDLTAPFSDQGAVTIRAEVSDGRLSDEVAWRFELSAGTNGPPTAVISTGPPTPKKGETISFDAFASSDPEDDIVEYRWSFSDGSTGEGAELTRTWTERGTYTVTLTVLDSKGNTDSTTEVITIGGRKKVETVESPWGPVLFVVLLVLFMVLFLYQAGKKGWLPVGKGAPPKVRAKGVEKVEEEEDEEGPEDGAEEEEEGDPDIEGGFEEIDLEEEELD